MKKFYNLILEVTKLYQEYTNEVYDCLNNSNKNVSVITLYDEAADTIIVTWEYEDKNPIRYEFTQDEDGLFYAKEYTLIRKQMTETSVLLQNNLLFLLDCVFGL